METRSQGLSFEARGICLPQSAFWLDYFAVNYHSFEHTEYVGQIVRFVAAVSDAQRATGLSTISLY